MDTQTERNLEKNNGHIAAIAALTEAARKPQFLAHPIGTKHSLVSATGDVLSECVPPRLYRALSVGGLLDQLDDLGVLAKDGEHCVRVFVGDDAVRVVLNERGDRQDTIELGLKRLESMDAIQGNQLRNIDQARLDWVLRSVFPGRVAPSSFLPMIGSLKFSSRSDGQSKVAHGRETVDAEIESKVTGIDGELDQEITLETSVFEELACQEMPPLFKIRCAVRINIEEKTFTIKPLEGQVAQAYASARQWIVDQIREATDLPDSVRVYSDSAF